MPEGIGYRSSFRTFRPGRDRKKSPMVKPSSTGTAPQRKAATVMQEFGNRTLHSGGSGEVVTNPKQAFAIAQSEARKRRQQRSS